ncbi:MAG: YybH family protein [Blastocatellia bacterium]
MRLPRITTLALVLVCLGVCAFATPRPRRAEIRRDAREAAAIRAVLAAQNAAWNAGNLEEFMKGYENAPDITFYSGGGMQTGWEAVLARYRKTYQSAGAEMGKLRFDIHNVMVLGREYAIVKGGYELTLSDGKKPHGLFTLLFHKSKDGWKAIHDHTSAGA